MSAAPKSKRGLASASLETRLRVAKAGGDAPHDKRGLQAADEETRRRVAIAGGHGGKGKPKPRRAAEVGA